MMSPISIAGGEYSVNGGPFTTAAGTITNGQTVEVRHTSAAAKGASVITTLTIGGVAGAFTSTTVAAAVVVIPTIAAEGPKPAAACTFNPQARFDPTLIGLLFAALGYLGWKRNSPKG